MRLGSVGSVLQALDYREQMMLRNDQQPTCTNATCGKQRRTIKHYLQECPSLHWNGGIAEKNYIIHGNIKTLLGRGCEGENANEVFLKIQRYLKKYKHNRQPL